jgi:hypothetical protein
MLGRCTCRSSVLAQTCCVLRMRVARPCRADSDAKLITNGTELKFRSFTTNVRRARWGPGCADAVSREVCTTALRVD